MKVHIFTRFPRLKEVTGIVLLLASVGFLFALASYQPSDPSWNNATWRHPPLNKIGVVGAHLSDLCFQVFGLTAWVLPFLMAYLGFRWLRNRDISSPFIRLAGYGLMAVSLSGALALWSPSTPYDHAFAPGGVAGYLVASSCSAMLNGVGAAIFLLILFVLALYLISTFSMAAAGDAAAESIVAGIGGLRFRFRRKPRSDDDHPQLVQVTDPDVPALGPLARAQAERRLRGRGAAAGVNNGGSIALTPQGLTDDLAGLDFDPNQVHAAAVPEARAYSSSASARTQAAAAVEDLAPWESDIPIRALADDLPPEPKPKPVKKEEPARQQAHFRLPPTKLLNAIPEKAGYDSDELKETATRIKAKLEEFNVMGNVVQINPGPVVTTFEFKPDAGVKIAKITTLTEDLCLGLQAESILIERIPGKPTLGIEVPNSRREMISLRQIIESDEFIDAPSRLTIALGKDISGRIRVTELEKMPHLLIAGSTGSGKSVMLNALIMSVLYKSTPDEVRLIMVDPKRVELGIYDGIPHLLTPVITEPKKAVNALRNAVLEMERRLKLLASYGVRNIDQFNQKLRKINEKPLSLFEDDDPAKPPVVEERPLPYILIIIDELADLMMLERAGVEESVISLAQMAGAVGMHLVLATQRPSVDVITGLIKANFPARISFRVATRVDSRTVLDVMGAEHLLGKGDMLFLPPGSSRLGRVHGAFVTENEINEVVDCWRAQAQPDYDQSYLIAPPSADDDGDGEEFDGEEDPMYRDAVRVVCEMGKASTSILQRRLRLGYGRAARILDQMQREGVIGPPDGSRPREIFRRPDWLDLPREEDQD
ncbi:MAG: DNA translocase FtsK [Bryobacterales bacterium]|nr:DNA translocase FtsK [Bryobacterales bacterium]